MRVDQLARHDSPATANSTLTLLGAENVRSSAAIFGSRPFRSSPTSPWIGADDQCVELPGAHSALETSALAPAPAHSPGASPRPE